MWKGNTKFLLLTPRVLFSASITPCQSCPHAASTVAQVLAGVAVIVGTTMVEGKVDGWVVQPTSIKKQFQSVL